MEITNGILTAARHGRLSRNLADEGLRLLLVAGIRLLPVDPLRVLALSLRWKVSAYDGAYLTLAEQLDSQVWTGDRAFYTACRRERLSRPVDRRLPRGAALTRLGRLGP